MGEHGEVDDMFERPILGDLPRHLSVLKSLGVEPPLFLMLSLLDVRGYTMWVNRERWPFASELRRPIDRDALVIPEIAVETFECDPAEVMRPAFDAIWNAMGWPRSINYNDEGKWVGQ